MAELPAIIASFEYYRYGGNTGRLAGWQADNWQECSWSAGLLTSPPPVSLIETVDSEEITLDRRWTAFHCVHKLQWY